MYFEYVEDKNNIVKQGIWSVKLYICLNFLFDKLLRIMLSLIC